MRIIGLSNYDIVIRRGDTFRLSVTARVKNGAAIDITGYTFLGHVRSTAGVLLATFTITITTAASGIFEVVIPAATTAALDTDANALGRYDIQWTTPAGDVRTIMKGNVIFESDESFV